MCGTCCCQQVCCHSSNVGNSLNDCRVVYIIPKDSLLADEISKGLISCTCEQNTGKATENQEIVTTATTEILETVTKEEQKEEPVIKQIEVKIKGKSEAVVVVFDSNVGADDSKDPQVLLFKEPPAEDRDETKGKQLLLTRKEEVIFTSSLSQQSGKDGAVSQPCAESSQQDFVTQKKVTDRYIHDKDSCCIDCCPDNKSWKKKKIQKKDKRGGFFGQCSPCCRSSKVKNSRKGKKCQDKNHCKIDFEERRNNGGSKYDRNKYDKSPQSYKPEKSNNEGSKCDKNKCERMKFLNNTNERSKSEAGKCVCEYAHRNACACTCTCSHKHCTNSTSVYSSSKRTSVLSYPSSSLNGSTYFPHDEYRRTRRERH